jgi:hypothetical protein
MTEEIRDFSRPKDAAEKPLRFRVDDDVFECTAEMNAGAQFILAQMSSGDEMEQMQRLGELLDSVLLPESAERFLRRMRDTVNPITTEQFVDIFAWLMEVYTRRPLLVSFGSANGQESTGTSSTDGASL